MFCPLSSGQRKPRICCADRCTRKYRPLPWSAPPRRAGLRAATKAFNQIAQFTAAFFFRSCIWCKPYSSGSQLPRPGAGSYYDPPTATMKGAINSRMPDKQSCYRCQQKPGQVTQKAPRMKAGRQQNSSSSTSLFQTAVPARKILQLRNHKPCSTSMSKALKAG